MYIFKPVSILMNQNMLIQNTLIILGNFPHGNPGRKTSHFFSQFSAATVLTDASDTSKKSEQM